MDFHMDILIKRCDLSKLRLSEDFIDWGGELLSQEPPKYSNESKLIFEQFMDLEYYKKFYGKYLGNDFDVDSYLALHLLGSHIFELELEINNNGSNIANNDLILFLTELSKLNSYALFFVRDEEYIDKRYDVVKNEELLDIICQSLNWASPEGVLIIKSQK